MAKYQNSFFPRLARNRVTPPEPKLLDENPRNQNSFLDKTLGTSMRLPEIMELLKNRDVEKNRGVLGIDKRALGHIGAALAQNPGNFSQVLSNVSKGLSNFDVTKKQDVRDALQSALGLAQEDLKDERLERQMTHELDRDEKRFAHNIELQNLRERSADKRAEQALTKAKQLEVFKKELQLNPFKFMPKDVASNSVEESNLRPITALSRPELLQYGKRIAEIQSIGTNAATEMRLLNEAEEILEELDGLGGILKSTTPQEFQSVFGNKQQTLLNRLDKINSLMYQSRVARRGGSGRVTDAEKAEIKKGLPSAKITTDANRALVDSKRRENAVDLARMKYYLERQKQGFEPNEIGFMASKEGQEALRQADVFGTQEDEEIEAMEKELAELLAEEAALGA